MEAPVDQSSGLRSSTPAASAPPNCAPCNDDYRTGGRCTVRTKRSTSPRNIRRGGKPVRPHPRRLPEGDHRRPEPSPPAVPADPQPLGGGATPRWPPWRPSWPCSAAGSPVRTPELGSVPTGSSYEQVTQHRYSGRVLPTSRSRRRRCWASGMARDSRVQKVEE